MLEGNGEIKKKEFTRFSIVIKILTDILHFFCNFWSLYFFLYVVFKYLQA